MRVPTFVPGQWPRNEDQLTYIRARATNALGPDYLYLVDDVVSKVCEQWALKESAANDRARIEQRIKTVAKDQRRSEQARKRRQERFHHETAAPPSNFSRRLELQEAMSSIRDPEITRALELVLAGYSITEVARRMNKSRYWVQSRLEKAARNLLSPSETP